MLSPWSVPEKKVRKWMWIALATVAALQFYYVQEMVAAFVVLGVVFALISGAGLLVLLVDRASERGLDWIQVSASGILRAGRQVGSFFGAMARKRARARSAQLSLSRTQLRHPRLDTAR